MIIADTKHKKNDVVYHGCFGMILGTTAISFAVISANLSFNAIILPNIQAPNEGSR